MTDLPNWLVPIATGALSGLLAFVGAWSGVRLRIARLEDDVKELRREDRTLHHRINGLLSK